MRRYLLAFLSISISVADGQATKDVADSIRITYKIPELAWAVVSADSVFDLQVTGVQRINTGFAAKVTDRFHIGSNTKAITSFIAALLVQQGKINWDTKFLELFPELKRTSLKVYRTVTLKDLLTFRGKLPAYTYTFDKPSRKEISGDDATQRFLLAKYFLSHQKMKEQEGLTPSNADYILAGLMLEKVSGKLFKELVTSFGKTQGIDFGFNYPNLSDTLQPWGHDADLKPQPPFKNYKLNWLLSAGNINVSLVDYIKFIQLQLKGLRGETMVLPQSAFERLLFGLPGFSFGWFNKTETGTQNHIAYNEGNAGAFITQVQIIKETNMAFIIFTNAAADETAQGIAVLSNYLRAKYGG